MAAYPQDRTVEAVVVADLQPGDVVLVRPGEAMPADGCVLDGLSSADESLLTGESAPQAKQASAAVTGGSINIEGPLVVRVEQVGEATRLSAIIRLMERAAMEKPSIVVLADRIAGHFILALLGIAAAVALGWGLLDPGKALWVTVSVLVVSCPCALSLATPVALTVASGATARAGVLVTRGHAIETLARATHFVFDKTGTLTGGCMRVLAVLPQAALDEAACLALAATVEQSSEHPVGTALRGCGQQDCGFRGERGEKRARQWHERPCRWARRARRDASVRGGFAWSAAAGRRKSWAKPAIHWVALGDASGWLAFFRQQARSVRRLPN